MGKDFVLLSLCLSQNSFFLYPSLSLLLSRMLSVSLTISAFLSFFPITFLKNNNNNNNNNKKSTTTATKKTKSNQIIHNMLIPDLSMTEWTSQCYEGQRHINSALGERRD